MQSIGYTKRVEKYVVVFCIHIVQYYTYHMVRFFFLIFGKGFKYLHVRESISMHLHRKIQITLCFNIKYTFDVFPNQKMHTFRCSKREEQIFKKTFSEVLVI